MVHDPLRDQTFVAERGGGATLDGVPVHASRVARLDHAGVGLDWGHSDEERGQTLQSVTRVAPRCGAVRTVGSAALALAYVAAGWLEAYFNWMMKPWDVAAGTLLVTEAGGRCTTFEGEPYRVDRPDCLATNELIHDELLGMVRET